MENTKIITFVARLDAFHFLGAETILTENTDFGAVWERFFALGGYAPIEPFQTDPSCVNIWRRTEEHAAYIQGKFVGAAPQPRRDTRLKPSRPANIWW